MGDRLPYFLEHTPKNSHTPDITAYVNLLCSIAFYQSEKISYVKIKQILKEALIKAKGAKLKSLIAHNLAVINYSELSDHNDRVLEILEHGGDQSLLHYSYSAESDEAIQKERVEKRK